MPISSKVDPNFQEDGQTKEALSFSFTNGAKEQLKELKEFYEQPNELEVLKLGISFLQRLKEQREKDKDKPSSPTT